MTRLILLLALLVGPALAQTCTWKMIPNTRLRYQDCGGSDAVAGSASLTAPYINAITRITAAGEIGPGTLIDGGNSTNIAPSVPVSSFLNGAATIADYGHASRGVKWMSADRTTLYGGVQTTLQKSVDEGVTWTTIKAFTETIYGVRELANGELLVSLYSTGAAPGTLWLTTNYPQYGASATWTKVLTCGGDNANYISGGWGMSSYKAIVVASEYGTKVTPTNAGKVYLSINSGVTWSTILDLTAVDGLHVHGVAYDPWWDAIWVVTGDTSANWATRVSWDRGANWTTVISGASATQYTGILPLPASILFTSDGPTNGVHRIPRTTDRSVTAPVVAYALNSTATITHVGATPFRAYGPDMPALLPFLAQSGPGVVVATYDGYNFSTIWTDTASYTLKGPHTIFGPTSGGNYVGILADDRQANYSRLTLPASPILTQDGIAAERSAAIQTGRGLVRGSVSGYYYTPLAAGGVAATTRTNGVMYAIPIYFNRPLVLDRIGVDVTIAGGAGSLIRLGIYNSSATNAGAPGTLLLDAGTVDSTGTGLLEITISQAVSAGTYWLIAVPQGTPTPEPTIRCSGGDMLGVGFSTGTIVTTGTATTGFTYSGVTGALPTPYVVGGTTGSAPRVVVRVL